MLITCHSDQAVLAYLDIQEVQLLCRHLKMRRKQKHLRFYCTTGFFLFRKKFQGVLCPLPSPLSPNEFLGVLQHFWLPWTFDCIVLRSLAIKPHLNFCTILKWTLDPRHKVFPVIACVLQLAWRSVFSPLPEVECKYSRSLFSWNSPIHKFHSCTFLSLSMHELLFNQKEKTLTCFQHLLPVQVTSVSGDLCCRSMWTEHA